MWMRKIALFVAAMSLSALAFAAPASDASIDELIQVARMTQLLNETIKGESGKAIAPAAKGKASAAAK